VPADQQKSYVKEYTCQILCRKVHDDINKMYNMFRNYFF